MAATVTFIHGDGYGKYVGGATPSGGGYRDYLDKEEPGLWFGRGLAGLGVERIHVGAEVDMRTYALGGDFEMLYRVLHPDTTEKLNPYRNLDGKWTTDRNGNAKHSRDVRGVDFTLSTPKSVSILYAVSSPEDQARIRAALYRADHDAMRMLDDFVIKTSAGKARAQTVDTNGLLGASFFQRSNVDGEPHLHIHNFVFNLVQRATDGAWRSIDTNMLTAWNRAVQSFFEARARAEIHKEFGVYYDLSDPKRPELVGMGGALNRARILAWSSPTVEIEEGVQTYGRDTFRSRQYLNLKRRLAAAGLKLNDRNIRPEDIWAAEAIKTGETHERIIADATNGPRNFEQTPYELIEEVLLGEETGVTSQLAQFTLPDLIEHTARLFGIDASEYETVFAHAQHFLETCPDVIRLEGQARVFSGKDFMHRDDGSAVIRRSDDFTRYTIKEIRNLESAWVDAWATTMHDNRGVVSPAVARFHRTHTDKPLDHEQKGLVTQLLISGNALDVIQGNAGVGKTTALTPCVKAWRAEGFTVLGVAHKANTARALNTDCDLATDTLAAIRLQIEAGTRAREQLILVIDEASMAATRDLVPVCLSVWASGGKVVILGDIKQIGSPAASGLFRFAVEHHPEVIHLTETHRFLTEQTQTFADLMATYEVEKAIDYAEANNMIEGGEIFEEVAAKLVDRYFEHSDAGQSVGAYAGTWGEALRINAAIRRRLVERGLVQERTMSFESERHSETPVGLGVGDHVVFTKNFRRKGIVNGGTAKILDVRCNRHGEPCMQVMLDDVNGRPLHTLWIPKNYLNGGHIELAYCTTTDAKQGFDFDHTLYGAGSARSFEEAYTAGSRAKLTHTMFVTDSARTEALSAFHRLTQQFAALEYMTHEQYQEGVAEWAFTHARGEEPLPERSQFWRAALYRSDYDQLITAQRRAGQVVPEPEPRHPDRIGQAVHVIERLVMRRHDESIFQVIDQHTTEITDRLTAEVAENSEQRLRRMLSDASIDQTGTHETVTQVEAVAAHSLRRERQLARDRADEIEHGHDGHGH